MIKIQSKLLNLVSQKAKQSPRKRMNYNFHSDLSDLFQRMLNCLEPETYCRPHRHKSTGKREVFIILRGEALVVQFDDRGEVTDFIFLNNHTGNFGVEIEPESWHTILSLEPDTVVYECKDGPYSPIDDKDFAPWAPAEGDAEAKEFNDALLKKLIRSK